MPLGCLGRICGALFQAVDYVWCGVGHGDRPVHNSLLTGLLELRLAPMGHCLPKPHQFGLGESLYAHVCHSEPGRVQSKPQGDRPQPELGALSVLSQQGMAWHGMTWTMVTVVASQLIPILLGRSVHLLYPQ